MLDKTAFENRDARTVACRRSGFTLIEMVATLIILGLLAAIVVPRYLEFVNRTSDTVATAAASEGLARFKAAYNQYLLETRQRPASLSDLQGPDYLNLNGDSRVNIGTYDVGYSVSGGMLTVQAYAKDSNSALGSVTAPWP
jgi:prepilin-type N-terminal cleavage/methylation domain-containing protein